MTDPERRPELEEPLPEPEQFDPDEPREGSTAIWLATLGEDEIDAAGGRLRGWSFCRAARLIGPLVVVVAGAALILGFAFSDRDFSFGAFG